jgi:2-octaprenyl-6-methoxyphenol hydroxylase
MPAAPVDVLIHGAGPVGCTAALALRQAGFAVALYDPHLASPAFRPLALSYASRLIFERLDIWRALSLTPIERIVVSQAGSFGRTRLDAADADVPALGYQTDYGALLRALRSTLAESFASEPVAARCIVHAEGAPADVAGKRYRHEVLVALLDTDPPALSTAYERFTGDGPLALLPLAGRYALIWSLRPERARELAQAPEREFLRQLARLTPASAGRLLRAESRAVQVPTLKVRRLRASGNEVFIGNAAQTLHPVAGQGLNLGLRDAWDLAQALAAAPPEAEIALTLARFAASRRIDATAAIRVTDFLASGFSSTRFRQARGLALAALDLLPAPRRFFARRMIFGARALP